MNGVIVGADDLGLSPGVTQGILDAYRDGVVRSTSLRAALELTNTTSTPERTIRPSVMDTMSSMSERPLCRRGRVMASRTPR